MKHYKSILIFLFFGNVVIGQTINEHHKKGTMYSYWGWNRGFYSNSDITFKGNNYNFTLKDVKAFDRQTTFGYNPYFKYDRITIPQTNFKFGYFIKDNISLSFGVDHMKYVMKKNQTVNIDGEINVDGSEGFDTSFNGTYSDDDQKLTTDFLKFEHTDGLNYLNLEINRFADLKTYFNEKVHVSWLSGFGLGFLYPKTNSTLMGNKRYDDFNIAGWGTDVKVGLNVTYYRTFMQTEFKMGYINMSDIKTTQSEDDSASQSFTFTQLNILFGYYF